MTIVPRQTDLIDDLINVAQRLGQNERGCTGGPDTEDTPPDTDAPGDIAVDDPAADPDAVPKQTISRDIIIAKEGARRQSGQLMFKAGGVWPKLGEAKLIGHGVNPDTYVADSVEFQGAVRYWLVSRRGIALPNLSSGVGSLMFQLPPGWWPSAQIERQVPTDVRGKLATLRVNTSGQVIYAAGPTNPKRVDLAAFGAFAGGGGQCPGWPAEDPTGAFDGRQWDVCDGGVEGDGDAGAAVAPTPDPVGNPFSPGGVSGVVAVRYVSFRLNNTRSGPDAGMWWYGQAHFGLPWQVGDTPNGGPSPDVSMIDLLGTWDGVVNAAGDPSARAVRVKETGLYLVEFKFVGYPDNPAATGFLRIGFAPADSTYIENDSAEENFAATPGSDLHAHVTAVRPLGAGSVIVPQVYADQPGISSSASFARGTGDLQLYNFDACQLTITKIA